MKLTGITAEQVAATILSTTVSTHLLLCEESLQLILKAGFPYDGVTIQADPIAQQNANGYLTALQSGVPVPFPIEWRTKENTSYFIPDLDAFRLFAAAMLSFVQQVFHSTWSVKDAIRSATTPAEITTLYNAYRTTWGLPPLP